MNCSIRLFTNAIGQCNRRIGPCRLPLFFVMLSLPQGESILPPYLIYTCNNALGGADTYRPHLTLLNAGLFG